MEKYIFCIMILFSSALYAQRKAPIAPVKDEINKPYDSVFKQLKWRNIGPYRGGRSNAVSGVVGNDQLYYAGYTGGGVWRTDDAGITWRNISDGQFGVGSIGDIAVAESDPNVIYVGTGEHAVRGVMTSYGDGVYKSVDGGKSWTNIGLKKTRHISDIVVHPKNADVVYVASQGTVHGNNVDRGVYKSTDGGLTWKKTLYINDSTGISSLSMDMNNPRVLYAASWEHRRLPWSVRSGGEGCAVWKSVDGGETWKKIMKGLPSPLGKIGVSVSRANSNRVYAIVESEKSKAGVYRSDDAGASWSHLSANQDLTARSWYYMEVFADPLNENVVYVLNAPMMRSIDGGKTWSNIRVGHGDTHDLWINPQQTSNLILGDDGGAEISFNTGKSWSSINNQPTAQFYRVNADNQFPYSVYGGQQDNTSVIIKSRTVGGGITEKDWRTGAGCESAYLAFDPNNPTMILGGCYQGFIERLDLKTGESKDIQAYPSLNLAIPPKDLKYRFNWNAPIITSPHDPKVMYHAGNVLFKTSDFGNSWEQISPDLTRNESSKQGPGGGPITNEGAGGENYNTIYYVAESPLEKGVIWTGSDCGLVQLTLDGGKNWKNVTPPVLPEALINSIELSSYQKGTAYVSATRYKFNDYGSYTFKTTDYGKTWIRISDGVQEDDFIRVIREDKKRKGVLYAGSERGFYISLNDGYLWQKFQLNLPVVPITDLMVHQNDLIASTAGRAFWILDDLGAIQQYQPETGMVLYQPKPAYHFGGGGLPDKQDPFEGANAPEGVILDYYLPNTSDTGTITLDIINGTGKVVSSYSNKKDPSYTRFPGGPAPAPLLTMEKGQNRFLWDLRSATLKDVPGVYIFGDYRGYRVAPGSYKAVLRNGAEKAETNITVMPDPNLSTTPATWQEQQQFMERVSADINEIHAAVNNVRGAKKQLLSLNGNLKDLPQHAALVKEGDSLMKRLEAWESNIVEYRITNGQDVINWPSKLNAEFFNVKGLADSHDPKITEGLKKRLTDLEQQWSGYKKQYEGDLRNAIDAYNKKYQQANIPAILIK
jgi:photosystem II stability/assembly factor-like uncharacterized protein